ncbi:VOC family protein [Psychromicrobium sp. YIM B11713]|uniref:VOC family protein n=1 Tax=Psychromicrobium sp. YIM B11713 TaxID=3145233 RepID=UPI00374F9D8A
MSESEIPVGAPCWIDLMTSDLEKSKAFYTALFGWSYETGDQEKYGGYVTASKDGKMVAGLMHNEPGSGYPDVWTTYLRTNDINKTVELATTNGGQVHLPPMDVPEQGRMGMLGDPSGAAVGLWEFGGHTGFQLQAAIGAPAWFELHTKNYPAALKFYQDVFGWQTSVMSDSEEFRYSTLGTGEEARAGLMDSAAFLPEGAPSNWQIYFDVENVDETIAKALELGAQVIQEVEDSPFGRLAALTDPTGAAFKLIED